MKSESIYMSKQSFIPSVFYLLHVEICQGQVQLRKVFRLLNLISIYSLDVTMIYDRKAPLKVNYDVFKTSFSEDVLNKSDLQYSIFKTRGLHS